MSNPEPKTRNQNLLIISHTGHYLDAQGRPSGWIPTVREIDFLAGSYNEIIHLAVLNKGKAPASTSIYQAENVKFISFPPFGGAGFFAKMSILWVMPIVLWKIVRILPSVDIFQFRAPTSVGLAIIPFLTLFSSKKGWYKYAGNWTQPNMPFSYRIQKTMLAKWQNRPVTINGKWEGQPKHVHAFENPCLNQSELPVLKLLSENRNWQKPYTASFVGRLDNSKGVDRIVELLLQTGIEESIGNFHFVGSGDKIEFYKQQLITSKVQIFFHGFSSREVTFDIYASSHLFMLPSDSEGFPKVVAEAAAFGCVPIVSDISSIGQYVNDSNGYLWPINQTSFANFVLKCDLKSATLQRKSEHCFKLAEQFTFESYLNKLNSLEFS